MTEFTHTGLSVVGLHEPEYSVDVGADGNYERTELPGFYSVGVLIEGVFLPLARFPAGRLLKDIERAKQPTPPATPPTG
jgi:hypothetical protein